mgnify:CR=1 FL=1
MKFEPVVEDCAVYGQSELEHLSVAKRMSRAVVSALGLALLVVAVQCTWVEAVEMESSDDSEGFLLFFDAFTDWFHSCPL